MTAISVCGYLGKHLPYLSKMAQMVPFQEKPKILLKYELFIQKMVAKEFR